MKVVVEFYDRIRPAKPEPMTLEAFAEKYDLTLRLKERGPDMGERLRWYAYFAGAEVKKAHVLISCYGNGATQEAAVVNYAKEISEKLLVFGAMTPERREIQVPKLIREGMV
jgi:hypothetical protein